MLVKNLVDQISTPNGDTLICLVCAGRWSANKGDYWDLAPNTELTCCNEPLMLGRVKEIIEFAA